MTPEEAARIQPGDVVYDRAREAHYVVGNVIPCGIAAPLFRLEVIGAERPHSTPGQRDPDTTSWQLCDLPQEGYPRRAPYRGGQRYSVRTLRERGALVHPIPGDEDRPDEASLDGPALRRRREALGLSQAKLAYALGVDPNTVAVWERNDRPIGNPVMVGLALTTVEQQERAGSARSRR